MKKIISILLFFAMILSISPSAFAEDAVQKGSGVKGDPYVITTLDQLKAVSDHSDAYFILGEDITEPLDTSLCCDGFTGNFDGNGHTITLVLTTDDPNGLIFCGVGFGLFDINDGVISNLNVEGEVNGSMSKVGTIAGENSGTISGCTSSVTVKFIYNKDILLQFPMISVGGIAGCNSGTISNCSASGMINVETGETGLGYDIEVGGLIGWNDGGTVSDSSASGTVNAGANDNDVNKGGLIGCCYNDGGSITNCSASGDVPASSTDGGADNQGGLIGYVENDSTTISDCYAIGDVTGGDSEGITRAGGLIGYDATTSAVSNCYATGCVSVSLSYDGSQKAQAGGLIGYLTSSKVQSCYSTGSVIGSKTVSLGGLIGTVNSPTVTGCYWNTITSTVSNGSSNSAVGTGLTTAQMTGAAVSTNMSNLGFNTNFTAMENTSPIWYYPQLSALCGGSTATKKASLASVEIATPFLSALNVSSGKISPNFSPDTTDYSVAVGDTVSSITLTPTIPMSASTIKVNGNTVTSGSTSGAINLSGVSDTITITITSTNGTYRNYNLTVTKLIPVTGITDVPTTATAGINLMLNGTVAPTDATNQSITWIVKDAGTTGATISGSALSTTGEGTVTVTATITDGTAIDTNYTKDFEIKVNAAKPADKILNSITAPAAITGLTNGTAKTSAALGLPSTVTLVTNDGSVSANVTWDVASCTYNSSSTSAMTFIVSGSVSLPKGVDANGLSLTTSISVSVNKASGSDGGDGSVSGGGSSGAANNSSSITVTTDAGTTTAAQTVSATTGSDGVATASVTKDQITHMMKAASKEAQKQNTQKSLEIKVDSGSAATGVSVTLPQATVSSLTDGTNSLTISSPAITVTFDEKALAEIGKNTNGDITVKAVKPEDIALSDADKAVIGTRPVYDLKVSSGSTTVSSFGGGTATVSIPYKLTAGEDTSKIVVYYISGSGELIMVPGCVYDASTGKVTFKTTHFSSYAVGYNNVSFTDVSGWYESYVNYLAARKIINGTGDGKFSPDANITRAEFVTILANLSGKDMTGYTSSSFTDVATTDWYNAAVQWAYKNGIAAGSDGKFAPGANITREQMAVMLYNYAKYAGTDVSNVEGMSVREFKDYDSISSWALKSIQWAMNNSIISGNSDGSFAPTANATRAQAAKMIAVLLQGMIGS